MTDRESSLTKGAPLRILFLICMIWLLGRLAWGSDMVLPGAIAKLFQDSDPIHSESTEFPNNQLLGIPFQSTLYDWIDGKGEFSDFDFIDPFLQSPRPARPRYNLTRGRQPSPSGQSNAGIDDAQYLAMPDSSDQGIHSPTPRRFKPAKQIAQDAATQLTELSAGPTTRSASPISVYFWLFARSGSNPANSNLLNTALLPGSAQYGGSQTGAIFSYRIMGDRDRNLSVYSRASSPLAVKNAAEIAIGTKVKPFKKLPISIHAEKRFRESASNGGATALFVAAGSGPDQIAKDIYLESYGQAGYVFQDNGSYFFDGSASVQKNILSTGNKRLSLGGAIWAGGQEDARRLDIGPRVNIDMPVGNIAARISIDWRQRVAGQAEPDSGIAISLSTSF